MTESAILQGPCVLMANLEAAILIA